MATSSRTRRNGMLSSCEYCRTNKVRCDHTMPQCGRCAARGLDCVYVTAPMTKQFRSFVVEQPERAGSTRTRAPVNTAEEAVEIEFVDLPVVALDTPSPITTSPAHNVFDTTPYSAEVGLAVPSAQSSDGSSSSISSTLPSALPSTFPPASLPSEPLLSHTIPREKIDLGLKVLAFVRTDISLLRNLLHHAYATNHMCIIPRQVLVPAVDKLYEMTANASAADDDSDTRLRQVIRLFENSEKPLRADAIATPQQACAAVSGDNLRWETLASMFFMATTCLVHVPCRDMILMDPAIRGRMFLSPLFQEACDNVSQLISTPKVADEFFVCAKYNQLIAALYRFGASTERMNTAFMELLSAVYAANMHQITEPTERPTFLQRWRCRCSAAVYSIDKTMATLLYRPPLMHRSYCILEPPLDIDEDDKPEEELQQQIQALNQNGWNTDGKRRPASFMRLRFILATVREEALELYVKRAADRLEASRLLLQKLQMLWRFTPGHLKYSSALWRGDCTHNDIWTLLCLKIEYLYSNFLIRRCLAQQDQSTKCIMFFMTSARDVLRSLLAFNDQRERLREIRSDFFPVFVPYGLPCARVLLAELEHRPQFFGHFFTRHMWNQHPLCRSETIRQLAVYVSCLGWASGQGSNNEKLCSEVKSQLEQALDGVIAGPAPDTGEESQDSDQHLSSDWNVGVSATVRPDLFSHALL